MDYDNLETNLIHFKNSEMDCNELEINLPSIIYENNLGLGLFASQNLDPGTIVALNIKIPTINSYISNHPQFKYSSVIHVDNGNPIWGRVLGKGRFCNHSCDPNCTINKNKEIITCKQVKKGQELTMFYDTEIPGISWQHEWTFSCQCQSNNCRQIINSYRSI